MGGSVGQWVVLGHITKYQIKLELIKIIIFCLKIYDCGDTPTYGWMGALMGGLMSNHLNQINFDLIEIIQLWTF